MRASIYMCINSGMVKYNSLIIDLYADLFFNVYFSIMNCFLRVVAIAVL